MIALLIAFVAAYGIHLVYTSMAFGWKGVQPGPKTERKAVSYTHLTLPTKA